MISVYFSCLSKYTELQKARRRKKKWKCHQTEKTVLIYWYLPVLTDESESKKSSFLSFIRADVFCWSTSVAICGFFWCWWNSNVSSLSSHWETLSNLSNFDDSSISTFFTINFVVRLLVSIFESSLSLQLISCTFQILKLSLFWAKKILFSIFLRFKTRKK